MKKHPFSCFLLVTRLLSVLFVAILVACSHPNETKQADKGRNSKPPTPVLVAQAAMRDVPVQLVAIGTVEPNITVQVKAQVSGQLEKVAFVEGQDVKQGDLLFVIDSRPFKAALNQALADLAKVKAQANYAETTNRRFRELERQEVVSKEESEQASSNAASLRAQVDAAQAAVESARLQLSYCTIRAPIGGRTGSLAVDVGNLVKANENPPLVSINQIQPVMVSFALPENQMGEIRQRMTQSPLLIQAYAPHEESRPATGTLAFIDNEVDRQTGTIRLKAAFSNEDKRLWPGQFVEVRLDLSILKNAVVVPTAAVQTGQSGEYVFAVQPDDTALVRQVETGPAIDGHTVILKGLQSNETVVTDGQVRLTPGAKVTIKQNLESEPRSGMEKRKKS